MSDLTPFLLLMIDPKTLGVVLPLVLFISGLILLTSGKNIETEDEKKSRKTKGYLLISIPIMILIAVISYYYYQYHHSNVNTKSNYNKI